MSCIIIPKRDVPEIFFNLLEGLYMCILFITKLTKYITLTGHEQDYTDSGSHSSQTPPHASGSDTPLNDAPQSLLGSGSGRRRTPCSGVPQTLLGSGSGRHGTPRSGIPRTLLGSGSVPQTSLGSGCHSHQSPLSRVPQTSLGSGCHSHRSPLGIVPQTLLSSNGCHSHRTVPCSSYGPRMPYGRSSHNPRNPTVNLYLEAGLLLDLQPHL